MSKKLMILPIAITLAIAGCAADVKVPHTEAYKVERFDPNEQLGNVTITSTDFDYEPNQGKSKLAELSEIKNPLADETYQYAMSLKKENPKGMIELLYTAAKQGSASAHYELARELIAGVNMDKNFNAGIEHLKDGAALNHAESLRILGLMNIRGDNMEVNIPAGLVMLEEAAKTSTRAASELAVLYKGDKYPQIKDHDKALQYLVAAYEKGDTQSAFLLGTMYYRGGEYIKAIAPLSFAAGDGHQEAKNLLIKIK